MASWKELDSNEELTEEKSRKGVIKQIARMQYGSGDQNFKSRLQQYFIENHKSSLRIRVFNFVIKVLSCILYCVRVVHDTTGEDAEDVRLANTTIKYDALLWVETNDLIWTIQTVVAAISIAETVLVFYIGYKGSILRLLMNMHFLLELITSAPLIVTIFVPAWRRLYLPIFLNCWLANGILENMLHDLHRVSQVSHSALFRQMIGLLSTLFCLIFTGACGMEHLQRAGSRHFDLFNSFYFIMVTFSTVGYGDFYPDFWVSQLFVVILIVTILAVLPSKIEALGQTWLEREKSGMDSTKGFGKGETHVVVTITHLEADFIEDFLTEFYAHPKHAGILIVLLSPSELDNRMKLLLKIPMWSHRVLYIRGSALKDEDLERALMAKAKACFILSARHVRKKNESDEQTILRSWAVKDFAPHVPQFVQVFRPETKLHIEHAEIIICEDEFKYSLLANNCICPGISTYITLLMHTSRGEEGKKSTEPWHKVYGFHSGNEIYDILVSDSKFFGEYVGKSFTYASFHAHKAFGVCLVGAKRNEPGSRILLNPGHSFLIQRLDRLYYIALTNEESLTDFTKGIDAQKKQVNFASSIANLGPAGLELSSTVEVPEEKEAGLKLKWKKRRKLLMKSKNLTTTDADSLMPGNNTEIGRRSSVGVVTGEWASSESEEEEGCDICGERCIEESIIKTTPPVSAYIGTSVNLCHMLKEKRSFCCLQISEPCEHCKFVSPREYGWQNPAIIVAVDQPSSGLYNLLLPLRAFFRPVHEIQPIILLLEIEDNQKPNSAFLDVIAWFPLIYWMPGKISSLDNLLSAGICLAEHIIVVKEVSSAVEEHLADCTTIITAQKIHRMFPKLKLITELTYSSNMRFMQFDPYDSYALQQSKFEKREKKHGSNLAFMFRLPFAQGGVFSANMLDRLLYQAFVKTYLVDFLKILLGIDQSPSSGYLASIKITEEDMWIRTYGRLYQKLCSSVADIPIGVYRTKQMDSKTISIEMERLPHSSEAEKRTETARHRREVMKELVKSRMQNLGMATDDYKNAEHADEKRKTLSYVIINPPFDLELEPGDIVYVLRAPIRENTRSKRINPRAGLFRAPNISSHTSLLNTYPEEASSASMLNVTK